MRMGGNAAWPFFCAAFLVLLNGARVKAQTFPTTRGISEFERRIALVGATVHSVTETYAVLEVTHVYCGSNVSVGDKFAVGVPHGAGQISGDDVYPPPTVEEVGLWVVGGSERQLRVVLDPLAFGGCFPGRKGAIYPPSYQFGIPSYPDLEAYAKVIEEVWTTDPKDRPKLLRGHMYSATPEVAGWAARALGEVDPNQLRELSRDEGEIRKLPLMGQVELDRRLVDLDDTWRDSDRRKRLMESWVENPGNGFESWRIIHYLAMWAKPPNQPEGEIIDLLRTLALNPKALSEARISATQTIVYFSRGGPRAHLASDALHEIAQRSTDEQVRHEAENAGP